ncbi:MAG: hypothetical protein AB7R77_20960 [Ilumatobacteraceae bacterium]
MNRAKTTDATQAWFWSPEWQLGEREAEADRAAGPLETFESGEQLVSALRSIAEDGKTARAD